MARADGLGFSNITQDVRYGVRQVRRAPGFFAIAALLIALGITATTQIFTLVDALFLRLLPVRDPQNLVQLFELQPKRPADPFFDYRFYKQLAQYSSTLFQVVGQIDTTRSLEQGGHAERIHTVAVTEHFFNDLGVPPLLGRVLVAGDNHVAVLSYACWSRSFGRDPKVLGQVVRLQGHSYTVVGVTREAFTGTMVDSSPDLWIPFANQLDFARTPEKNLDGYVIEIVARLHPGVSLAQAQQETASFWNRHMRERDAANPADYGGLKRGRLEVHSIANGVSPLRDQSKTPLLLLSAGTGLVLLMVCANVGGLLLSRATVRERETAVRVALGANRLRILRQWVVEGMMLSFTGGMGGILLAWASLPILMRWMPPTHGIGFDPAEIRAPALHPQMNFRVVAFSLGLCMLTALMCAVAPAWRTTSGDVTFALKSTMSDRRHRFFQSALCGFQIALCTMLLLSAGLITRSLSNLQASGTGFNRDHVTVFSVDPHVRGYDKQKTWLLEQKLLSEVRNLPGVEGAALANRALMRGIGLGTSIVFPGERGGGIVNTSVNDVSPRYFDVMGIHLAVGRDFGASDMEGQKELVNVIVNQAFVRKFLNGKNPLGEKFDTGQQFVKPSYEVIGVVNDTKYRSLREIPPPILYTCGFGPKAYPDTFILHVRSKGDPRMVIQPVRQLLRSIDPELPLYQIATLSEEADRSLWQEHLLSALTTCFGAFALLLSAMGVYGVLAYFVARRQREIGLRLALGATTREVTWLVVRRVLPILVMGIIAGASLSWLSGAWVQNLLYDVKMFDPLTNIAVMGLLIAIGIAGAAAPAVRAIHVDPSSSLRED